MIETNGDSDRAASPVSSVNQDNKPVVKLVKAEDRKIGAVGFKTLIAYYDAASNGKNGILFCSLVLSMFVVAQGIRTVDDIFLSLWSRDSMNPNLFTLYAVFAALTFIFYVISSLTFVWAAIRASRVFHARIFSAVLRAPINTFFDVTPVGQILNRFTKDIDQIDMLLPDYQVQFLQNSLYFIGAATLCVYSNPFFCFNFTHFAGSIYQAWSLLSCGSTYNKEARRYFTVAHFFNICGGNERIIHNTIIP